ncbi:prosaposin-like [Drosophila innubila]|uniref:prosaposin-like n=1 Tax=Drosophila innubila TaxID=198719 RepID=UPI00148D12D2|nr:prosaposin-like [Drosophila innubila]
MGIAFPLLFVAVFICCHAIYPAYSGVPNDVKKNVESIVVQPDQLSCSTCNLLSLIMKEKFESVKREDMVERMLHTCYSLEVLSETCVNIVSNYFDDMYDLLKEQLQSNDICAASGICAEDNLATEPEELKSQRKHDEFHYAECKQIAKHLHETLIRNATEAQFKKMLMGVCTLTSNFKSECLKVVDQYSHVIYGMLKNDLNADSVCLLIGVCHKKRELDVDFTNNGNELQTLVTDEDPQMPQCLLCKTAFRIAKKIISKHASNDQVKDAMNRACNKLGKVSKKCHDFVNKHGNGIIRFVRNPRVICSMLGMCFPIGQETKEYEIADSKSQVLPNNIKYNEDVQLIADALTKDSENCFLCKKVIKTLQNLVKHHHDINNALKNVCHMLKEQSQKDKCRNMVEKHSDLIVDLVSKNVAHQQICRTLSMCLLFEEENDVELEELVPKLNNEQFELETPQPVIQEYTKGVPKCSICKVAMKALKAMIHHGGKDEIKRALSHVCHKVGKLHHVCEKMVSKHSDQIVDLITKNTPPKMICKMIGMCHQSASQEESEIDETLWEEQNNQISDIDVEITASPKCFLCKKVIKALQHMVQHHGDKGSIERAMQKVCSKLGKLSKRCDRMVQRYGNKIIDLMVKHVAVQRICNMIGVCKKSISIEDFEVNETVPLKVYVSDKVVVSTQSNNQHDGLTDPKEGPICIICELLIARLKATVDTEAKRDKVLHSILYTCSNLPKFIREPCHFIVHGYGEVVLNLIMMVKPHEMCHILQTINNQTTSDGPIFLQDFEKELDAFLNTNCALFT